MRPHLTVDAVADAAYVRLRPAAVARTEAFSGSVLVDVDTEGAPVGVEILALSADVDVDGIADRYGLSDTVRADMRQLIRGQRG